MGEHSPGPWEWDWLHDHRGDNADDCWRSLLDADERNILQETVIVKDADAVLIAAAPQLLDHLQRWHVAAHPRGDDSCETCQFLKARGLPITTP